MRGWFLFFSFVYPANIMRFSLQKHAQQVSARLCTFAVLLATTLPPMPTLAAQSTSVIDNGDAAFSAEGWMLTVDPTSGYEGDVHYIKPQTTSTPASWEFTNLEPGTYRVSAHWVPRTWLNPQAQYTVAGASSQTVTIDQRTAPSEWNTIVDAVTVDDMGTLRIELTSSIGDKYLYADAVKVEKVVDVEYFFSGLPSEEAEGEDDTPAIIDLLIVYSPDAARDSAVKAGAEDTSSVEPILGEIYYAVQQLNDTFVNSNISAKVNVRSIRPASDAIVLYPNQAQSLNAVFNDDTLEAAERDGADIVIFIGASDTQLEYCGVSAGFTEESGISDPADVVVGSELFVRMATNNYLVVMNQKCLDKGTLAHEVGHLLGAGHQAEDTTFLRLEPWANAYDIGIGNRRTLMYSEVLDTGQTRVLVFSQPNLYYRIGDISYELGSEDHNNARTVRKVAPLVAQYRDVPLVLEIQNTDLHKTVDTNYIYRGVKARGGVGAYSWSMSGHPNGLTISNVGVIYGTPTEVGTFTITVRVQDEEGTVRTKSTTLTVHKELNLIEPPRIPAGVVGQAYPNTAFVATDGIPPYSWSAEGLPDGLRIDSTGVVYGTPTRSGTFSAKITVRDQDYALIAQRTFTVLEPLTLTAPSTVPTGTVGTPYAATTFSADGGDGNYTWSASNLPAGLQIDSTGAVYGTPTAAGTKTATITVRDGTGQTKSTTVSITVNAALSIVPERGAMPWGIVGEQYAVALRALGAQGTVTWAATALPTGVSFADGVFSGTLSREGTFTPLISAEDASGTKVFYRPTVQVFAQDFDFYNDDICLDVNDDGIVSPFDFLNVINALNAISHNAGSQGTGMRYHPDPASVGFVDTDGNGVLTPLDGLRILNYLNDDDPNKDPRSRCN